MLTKISCSAAAAWKGVFRRLLEIEPARVPADEEAKARRRRACNWLRLLLEPRPDPEPIRPGQEVDAHDPRLHDMHRLKLTRSEIKALNHKIVLQCLERYNSAHPGDEYEPAPGVVTRRSKFNNYLKWTHGNFVARRKRFSFLPAPRTLFFFELLSRGGDVNEVITCTPLLDEPVTEAYVFLGFPLGRGTRRYGGSDCVCMTCYRRFHVPHIDLKRTCVRGNSKVESVCKMCYLDGDVIHPFGGEFTFGHRRESFAYMLRSLE